MDHYEKKMIDIVNFNCRLKKLTNNLNIISARRNRRRRKVKYQKKGKCRCVL